MATADQQRAAQRNGNGHAAAKPVLNELGEKIFLDRYALKDMTKKSLAIGDTVIVCVNQKTRQREIGKVLKLNGSQVSIELRDGSITEQAIEDVDKPLETEPSQMMDRVARGIAAIETSTVKQQEWERNFRWLLDDWKFVPGGRILTAAGTDQKLTFFNCYVVPSPEDSRRGIVDTLSQMMEIMSRGGGVGINISSLRPQHAYVKGVNGRSSGSVSWGGLYSFVTGLIEQGGCFGPAERILTNKGLIPALELAERLDAGEQLLAHTHKGFRPFTHVFRNGTKPLYEVTTKRGNAVRVTLDHKMAVLRNGAITTVPLRELLEGEEILLLLGEGVETDYVPLAPPTYKPSIMSTRLNTDLSFPAELNEDLAYLLGYMHGDGYVHVGKKVTWQAPKAIKLATADAYPTVRQRLIDISLKLFGLQATVEDCGESAHANVGLYSRLLVEWLTQHGLLKAKAEDIRVPEAIFRSPSSVMGAFIAGYFDADGCNRGRKSGYGMDSISRAMLQDVQQLLAINGIVSAIHTTDRSQYGWQTNYRLNVTGATFKQRFADFVPSAKITADGNGKRDMYQTYPAEVWTSLGARSKYRQRIYDGYSERISFGQLTSISTRLATAGEVAVVEAIADVQRTLPDTIVSIVPVGNSLVYDFEVDDVHLLSGNGIYTSNSRRGALMLILNVWHPDVLGFINAKREAGKITNANISVGLTDAFMEAVEADADWDLVFPDPQTPNYNEEWDGDIEKWRAAGKPINVHRTVKARTIWNSIVESAWASAEPGLWFIDRTNKMSNSAYFSPLICTNPCGEQPLPAWGICNLGAINLGQFVKSKAVEWDELKQAVRYAVRFLDNVIDATPYFFDENQQQQQNERRVGLGIMGLADMLIRLEIRYGSPECITFLDQLGEVMATEAYLASTENAAEKGSFPKFDAEKLLMSGYMQAMPEPVRQAVREKGLRNVTLLTVAPTGTTGTMVATSTGVEPYFSWSYFRKSRLGVHEEKVAVAQEWEAANPGRPLPDYFVNAMELSPKEHVDVQAALQRWIDSAISKTANLPHDYTVEQTRELYEYMYKMGCKGGTTYRDGSRDEQVLNLKQDEPKAAVEAVPASKPTLADLWNQPKIRPRPKRSRGVTVQKHSPLGSVFVTVNDDDEGEPLEIFVTAGKAGSDVTSMAEALGRLASLVLRVASPVAPKDRLAQIAAQLKGIGGARSMGFGKDRVRSLPDAVAQALEDCCAPDGDVAVDDETETAAPQQVQLALPTVRADLCPSCGEASFVHAEGCMHCDSCGFSQC